MLLVYPIERSCSSFRRRRAAPSEKFERDDVRDLCQHHIGDPHFLAEFAVMSLHPCRGAFDDSFCS